MTLGIIAAMSEELEILLKYMQLDSSTTKAGMTFNKGKLWSNEVIAVVCGIGKVNAAVCTQILVSEFNVDKVINVGVAGGIGKDIYPGDVVIATNLVEHDMDTTAFGDPHGQVPRMDTFDFKCDSSLIESANSACKKVGGFNTFTGRIVSGDVFVADVEKIKWLEKEFNALSCEMEGASIAVVSSLLNIPFCIIRAISDSADDNADISFDEFLVDSAKKSASFIISILDEME